MFERDSSCIFESRSSGRVYLRWATGGYWRSSGRVYLEVWSVVFICCLYFQQKALTLTENGFVKKRTFKLCLEQTAQGKMTARTIGSFHVFGKKCDLPCIYQSNLTFWGTPPLFSFSLIINSFHKDLMWEALVFSKEIVLVFSKVGASGPISGPPIWDGPSIRTGASAVGYICCFWSDGRRRRRRRRRRKEEPAALTLNLTTPLWRVGKNGFICFPVQLTPASGY